MFEVIVFGSCIDVGNGCGEVIVCLVLVGFGIVLWFGLFNWFRF